VTLIFAPDGQRGAVVSGQSEVSIYDLVHRTEAHFLPDSLCSPMVRYAPDGRRIAISSPLTKPIGDPRRQHRHEFIGR